VTWSTCLRERSEVLCTQEPVAWPLTVTQSLSEGVNFCRLAFAALEALDSDLRGTLSVAELLDLSFSVTVYSRWVSLCEQALNEAIAGGSRGATTVDRGATVLEALAEEHATLDVERRLVAGVLRASGGAASQRRSLLARTSSKSSKASGGSNSVVPTADVSGQGWTLDDLDIRTKPFSGELLPPRMLGTWNTISGGILIQQVRLDTYAVERKSLGLLLLELLHCMAEDVIAARAVRQVLCL
jgi:hypothetical protein